MTKQIFTYWEGTMYPYIGHCLKTIQEKSGVPVSVVNSNAADNFIGDVLHPNYRAITNIAQRVDVVRLAILYTHGGMWCDADTIFIRDCNHLFNSEADFIGLRWTHNRNFNNGYWFCKKESVFIKACIDDANENLKTSPRMYYGSPGGCFFGEELFARVLKAGKFKVQEYPLDTMIPVNFPFNEFIWKSKVSIDKWLSKQTVAIALNNSQLPNSIKHAKVEDIAARDDLIGSIFRYSGIDVEVRPEIITTPKTKDGKAIDPLNPPYPAGFGPSHKNWNNPGWHGFKVAWLRENGEL